MSGTLDPVAGATPAPDAFLDRLDLGDRGALLDAGHPRHYRAGETIFRAGEPGSSVVLVTQGRVKVIAPSPTGSETVISLRGAGDLLGELAAIDDTTPRVATVVALDPVVCRVMRAAEFRSIVAERPAIAIELLRMVAARLHSSDQRLVDVGAYDTTRRVARLLAEMATADGRPSGTGVVLKDALTQDELAGLVGASRESVARALATLRELGLVSTGRRHVVVLDLIGLERYAAV